MINYSGSLRFTLFTIVHFSFLLCSVSSFLLYTSLQFYPPYSVYNSLRSYELRSFYTSTLHPPTLHSRTSLSVGTTLHHFVLQGVPPYSYVRSLRVGAFLLDFDRKTLFRLQPAIVLLKFCSAAAWWQLNLVQMRLNTHLNFIVDAV